MTCLTLVQSVCKRVGLPSPTTAVGSSDLQILQIVEISNEAGQEVSRRYPWQALINEATYTTLATEIQGDISTIAPGLDYVINDTIWNRSLRRPVYGPKTAQSWQQQKAFSLNGPWSGYRVIDDDLHMYPVPTAGETCAFEYVSKNWVTVNAGGSDFEWNADADTSLIDEQLLVLDTIWRWKQAKGLAYAEDFAKSERRIIDSMARDGGKDWLSLSGTRYDIAPGVVVPAGSWNL